MHKAFAWLPVFAACAVAAAPESIRLNEKQYYEAPGFSFLLFHNNYQVGYQGGLQMILHEERLLDCGDLYVAGPDADRLERRVLRRTVDPTNQSATVFGEVAAWKLGYRLITRTDGQKILITLKLDRPVDPAKARRAAFRIALYPGAYFEKSYQTDAGSGVFPHQFLDEKLVRGSHVVKVAQEDRLRRFTIRRTDGGTMDLTDPRRGGPQAWFWIEAPLAANATEAAVEITPSIDPEWRRPPVIAVSQVGYQPNQPKRAIIELDSRDQLSTLVLKKLELSGDVSTVRSAVPKAWGKFLRYQYATFDFSDVREPGIYTIEYGGQAAGPFRIAKDVYRGVWEPTLEYFLPAQMCHVAVKEGGRTWHGPCHLDDAIQAPADTVWIDGYRQGERETRFADNQHIPGLDWGGWHDAGDNDLPAGSIAMTTMALALAQEEFNPRLDQTSVERKNREVLLHKADGRPDLVQQIEYGVEGMLASFRVAGHIFPGIIESTHEGYGHLGDPVNITDNRIYDPKTNPKRDDRWAFTNRHTGLQYEVVQALAASNRAIKEASPSLAAEALAAARKIYDYEQERPPVYPQNTYTPRDSGFRAQEISASAEMFLTTGEPRYKQRLLALLPQIKGAPPERFELIGPTLVRVLPAVKDESLTSAVTELARKWKGIADRRAASNPFGVEYPREVSSPDYTLEERSGIHSGFVWGHGWNLQSGALASYYYYKHLPQIFGKEDVFRVVDFVLGCHPASNESFVSGVGARSPIIAYGYNRAEWSHIPGGVISGNSLVKPDFMELKEFPFLWYQTEYVIGGAATYIFDVLAAEKLATEE